MKEIEPIDGWPAFTYHLAPTYDFKQELLSHGAFVEVLSPDWFRDDILPYFSEEDEYEL